MFIYNYWTVNSLSYFAGPFVRLILYLLLSKYCKYTCKLPSNMMSSLVSIAYYSVATTSRMSVSVSVVCATVLLFGTMTTQVSTSHYQSYNDTKTLLCDLFQDGRYHTDVPPMLNQSSVLTVHVDFVLTVIIEINDVGQKMHANTLAGVTWKDEVRKSCSN